MITRPLDLAAKLRPEPRNFDFLFLVNGGLIVQFFMLFGSPFVLAPALGVDFQLPTVPGTVVDTALTTHYISVKRGGMIFVADQGQIPSLARFREWLTEQAKGTKRPVLLIRADAGVETSVWVDIVTAAHEAGFETVLAAETVPAASVRPN